MNLDLSTIMGKSPYANWTHSELYDLQELMEKRIQWDFMGAIHDLHQTFVQMLSDPEIFEHLKKNVAAEFWDKPGRYYTKPYFTNPDFMVIVKIVQGLILENFMDIIEDTPEYKIAVANFWHHSLFLESSKKEINTIAGNIIKKIKDEIKMNHN